MRLNITCGLMGVLLIAIVSSCISDSNSARDNIPLDEFKAYSPDIGSSKVPMAELIQEVELMRFEETEQSLLSRIGKLHQTEDSFIFLNSSENNQEIFIYTKEGKFRSKISRQGEGPEEYKDVTNIWLDDGRVFVYSNGKKVVKSYDLKGNFIKSYRPDAQGVLLMPYEDGYLLNTGERTIGDSLNYSLVKLNKAFQLEALFLPFARRSPMLMVSEWGFRRYKKGLTYSKAQGDTLYYVQGDQIQPLMKFDFGNDWLWKDERLLRDNSVAYNAIRTKDMVWYMDAFVYEDWVYLSYVKSMGKGGEGLILNRITGSYKNISFKAEDGVFVITPLQKMGDRLLMSMSSEHVSDFLAALDDDQWRFREGTTLEEIEASEHPVFAWVRFKPF